MNLFPSPSESESRLFKLGVCELATASGREVQVKFKLLLAACQAEAGVHLEVQVHVALPVASEFDSES